MRPLLLLLAVLLAFLAVRWFRPAAAEASGAQLEAAGDADGSAPDALDPAETGPVRFLTPPAPSASTEPARRAAELPTEAPAASSWPASLLPVTASGAPDEVSLGAALLHGTPADVQARAGGLPEDRARLLESFAWALAGERQTALSVSEGIGDAEGLDRRERALFEAALVGRAAERPSSEQPVALAMEMALLAREARRALAERDHSGAAAAYSTLLKEEIRAPWPADRPLLAAWSAGLDAAQREHRWNPRGGWPALEITVENGDTLIAVRKRYLAQRPGALLCTGLIERANRIQGHLQPGQVLRVPTDPVRILVDLADRWALYFLGDEVAAAWPVGIGRPGEDTPPGDYRVRNKLENPPWMKEGQEPIPFGDPRNPLGTRWLGWSTPDGGRTSYGFHGTWEPESIGHAASDGCIRLLNEDVEELFQILPEGAPIRVEG